MDSGKKNALGKLNFPGFQKILDFTSAGSESSVSVAVDGDTDKEYRIVVRNPNSNGSPYVKLLLNNDATSGRYGVQYIANSSGTLTAVRTSTTAYMTVVGGLSETCLLTPSGFVKTLFNMTPYWSTGTTISYYEIYGATYTQTGNVTSLNFLSSSGNFTSGTRITVFARRA